ALELRLRLGRSAGVLQRLAGLGHLRLSLLALLGGSLAIEPAELASQLLLLLLSATQGLGLLAGLSGFLRLTGHLTLLPGQFLCLGRRVGSTSHLLREITQ